MSNSPFELQDDTQVADKKFCPMIKADCVGAQCQFWVSDYMEDKQRYRMNCAVPMIALALTDEALLKIGNR